MEKFTPLTKIFTLLPAVTALTNSTSVGCLKKNTNKMVLVRSMSSVLRINTDGKLKRMLNTQKMSRSGSLQTPLWANSKNLKTLKTFNLVLQRPQYGSTLTVRCCFCWHLLSLYNLNTRKPLKLKMRIQPFNNNALLGPWDLHRDLANLSAERICEIEIFLTTSPTIT